MFKFGKQITPKHAFGSFIGVLREIQMQLSLLLASTWNDEFIIDYFNCAYEKINGEMRSFTQEKMPGSFQCISQKRFITTQVSALPASAG